MHLWALQANELVLSLALLLSQVAAGLLLLFNYKLRRTSLPTKPLGINPDILKDIRPTNLRVPNFLLNLMMGSLTAGVSSRETYTRPLRYSAESSATSAVKSQAA
jgi:hypothetical protein